MKPQVRYALLPTAIFFVILLVGPFASFVLAGFRTNAGPAALGDWSLDVYRDVLTDRYYLDLFFTTAFVSAMATIICLVLGFPMAYAIARGGRRWAQVIFFVTIASMFTSFIVASLGLKVLLSNNGVIADVLRAILGDARVPRLANTRLAVVVGMANAFLPFCVLALIPVCETIPRSLLYAARGLGASSLKVFSDVIFPLTSRGIAITAALIFAVQAGSFVTPLLLGGARVRVVAIEVAQLALQLLNYPKASVLATLLVIGVALFVGLFLALFGRRKVEVL
jgi:putative spermidine/putrescine transport system permease protein